MASAWAVFVAAAAASLVCAVGFVLWLHFQFGGSTLTVAVDDIGEGVAALVAAVCCGLAARRTEGRRRRAWTLIGLSAASWAAGEAIWSINEVGLGITLPFPSLADLFYLGAIPLEIAGILAFGQAPRGTSTGLRLWVDALVVGLSLLFVGWALGLQDVYTSSGSTLFARLLGLAYPLGDILVGTVLVFSIRRATREQQGPFLLLLAGMAAISLSDSAFAYLTAKAAYFDVTVLDAGWLIGFLLITLAALWPAGVADRSREDTSIDLWQLALPWLGVLAVAVTVLALALTGQGPDTPLMIIAGLLTALLFVSQTFAHRESFDLLVKSRQIGSTLNEMITHAPLGIVRLSPDLAIVQANPRAAALLGRPEGQITGSSIDEYFAAAESVQIHQQLLMLAKRSGYAEFDIESRRTAGNRVFIHWSVTTVRDAGDQIEYFIAMLEDVSARREADLTALANVAALERLNRLKTDFLTRVRHEFRTALVGIQGFSELMRDTEEMEVAEVRTIADDIYRDAQRLDRALSEMLAVDRSETGRLNLQVSQMDINEVIVEIAGEVQSEARSVAIQLDLDQEASRPVFGDRSKLGQVIATLLRNGVDHSPSGGAIAVMTRARDGDAEIVIFDHHATGLDDDGGAPPPDVPAVPAVRQDGLPPAGPVSELGGGLSLPVARQIVELHGGKMSIEKSPEAGVEIHLTIPFIKEPAPAGR